MLLLNQRKEKNIIKILKNVSFAEKIFHTKRKIANVVQKNVIKFIYQIILKNYFNREKYLVVIVEEVLEDDLDIIKEFGVIQPTS